MKYKRGWNISNKNLKEIYDFIDNYVPRNDIEKRDIKILKYAFEDNMTAVQIANLKDKDIICYSNRAKGHCLSNGEISRIIRSYNLINEKRIDYSNRNNYERRKRITRKKLNGEIDKPKICSTCGGKENLELHHIIPIILGGNDDYYNLIYLCSSCHRLMHQDILNKLQKKELLDL